MLSMRKHRKLLEVHVLLEINAVVEAILVVHLHELSVVETILVVPVVVELVLSVREDEPSSAFLDLIIQVLLLHPIPVVVKLHLPEFPLGLHAGDEPRPGFRLVGTSSTTGCSCCCTSTPSSCWAVTTNTSLVDNELGWVDKSSPNCGG
jgi:hypothetical protein